MSAGNLIADAVAAFMKGDRTSRELGEHLVVTRNTSMRILRTLRDAGLVYIAYRRSMPMNEEGSIPLGAHKPVYRLQPKPFECSDAPITRKAALRAARK